MEVIPAVDIRGGKCVRLYQGDFAKETVYDEDPVHAALHWQEQGAPRLHVVDLDGALKGEPANLSIVLDIIRRVSIPVQVGGGVRTLEAIDTLLRAGAAHVVLGTIAFDDPSFVEQAVRRFGDGIAVGVDAKDGQVATEGWKRVWPVTAIEFTALIADAGVRRVIYTDIGRDGTLKGPNFDAIAKLQEKTGLRIVASGGISSIEDIRMLAEMGCAGAITGRALYTGALDLKAALRAAAKA